MQYKSGNILGLHFQKYVGFLLLILFSLLLILLSYPRIASQETVPAEALASYPELYEAYQTAADLTPGSEILVLEVKSIWGSCDYYILPCYWAEMRAVPQNGQANWATALDMVTACSPESSLTAKLCRLDVRNLRLEVNTGEETLLSSRVEIYPGDSVYDMSETPIVEWEGVFDCAEHPVVRFGFLAGTSMGAETENETVSGSYVWNYDLYCCGKRIRTYREVTLTQDYRINAA